MTQNEALTILKTGANVFLTGEPGSGKTHTINSYIKYLKDHEVDVAITASTGIASTHIGGLTIHSWAGIGIKSKLSAYDIDKIATTEYVVRRVSRAMVLIIDEVSMLAPDTLNSVDMVCRAVRNSNEPFGGMQVIFVGDFFQLPPVVKKEPINFSQKINQINDYDEFNQDLFGEKGSLNENNNVTKISNNFAYEASAWKQANPIVCYLNEQHRQDDQTFLKILSAIRRNEFNSDHLESIEERRVSKEESRTHYPKLFSRNVNVDTVNDSLLASIQGTGKKFEMLKNGNPKLVDNLIKGCLSPEVLRLKVGAHVMCTKNNPRAGYANGTLGVIAGFDDESSYPIIKTKEGETIKVEPAEWIVEENGVVKARIIQVPLRLAWAITVHKSQGMSMDKAVMDLSDVFEYGQGYVALSRVRKLEGVYILGFNPRAFQVHPEVLRQDEIFRKLSEDAQVSFENLLPENIKQMHNNFIVACGGISDTSDEDRSNS